ncbi:hypothetical protein Hanom_Chr02g00160161 [Helianthus anomalus]
MLYNHVTITFLISKSIHKSPHINTQIPQKTYNIYRNKTTHYLSSTRNLHEIFSCCFNICGDDDVVVLGGGGDVVVVVVVDGGDALVVVDGGDVPLVVDDNGDGDAG